MRFISVNIAPWDPEDAQLSQFLACFTRERAHAAAANASTPHVHHLFLATYPSKSRRWPWSHTSRRPTKVHLDGGDASSQTPTFQEEAAALVELVAPYLHTLALVNNSHNLPPSLARAPHFPQLRELTIVDPQGQLQFTPEHYYWMSQMMPEAAAAKVEEAPLRFPRLERLNMLGCRNMQDLGRWAIMAPRLTHLRISHLSLSGLGCKTVYQVLAMFCEAPDGERPVQLASP